MWEPMTVSPIFREDETMSLLGQPGNPRRMVSEKDVKLCALCGALNHRKNTECFTCGWRGVFEREPSTVHLAWQRLYDEFECVDMEHITGSHSLPLNELGVLKAAPVSRRWTVKVRDWWRNVLAKRDARAEERERPYRQQAGPPNGLGV